MRGKFSSQYLVVLGLLFPVQQANARCRQLVEKFLRKGRVLARLERPHVSHLPVGGVGNGVGIFLEQFERKQRVRVRRLVLGRYPEPFAVRIESFGHLTNLGERSRRSNGGYFHVSSGSSQTG